MRILKRFNMSTFCAPDGASPAGRLSDQIAAWQLPRAQGFNGLGQPLLDDAGALGGKSAEVQNGIAHL